MIPTLILVFWGHKKVPLPIPIFIFWPILGTVLALSTVFHMTVRSSRQAAKRAMYTILAIAHTRGLRISIVSEDLVLDIRVI